MSPRPRYRLDGAVGLIVSGLLLIVFGIVTYLLLGTGEASSSNARVWFFALLGVPLGIALLIAGIVTRRRDRRS